MSYLTESEAPRDFRVSSTESESFYTKCLLCYTIKKNFYCVDCIKAGNFAHSTMPYSDRFADKQLKLLRVKANRKHIQDRCENLLLPKTNLGHLQTEMKHCKDQISLLRLAIEQTKKNVETHKSELVGLTQYNRELGFKLPRYQKRVTAVGKHSLSQAGALQEKISLCYEKAKALAALRRKRIRQLIKYIFPVFMTYDTSESVEELEFLHIEGENDTLRHVRLHVVEPWIPANGDYSLYTHWGKDMSGVSGSSESNSAAHRLAAGLSFAAQLTALMAWCLDVRLPYPLNFSEYGAGRLSEAGVECRVRRLCACTVALGLQAEQLPPSAPRHALTLLHNLAFAATTDNPSLGRVESWVSNELSTAVMAWEAAWRAPDHSDDEEPPEHLHWADLDTCEDMKGTPPGPQTTPSLVTSAAASIASIWRGWTK